jgi:purine-binding chemotaxis protein CheW
MQSTATFDQESLRDPDRPHTKVGGNDSTDYFVFRLCGRTYALMPGAIDLVAPTQPIVPVPTAGPFVRGVIHLRGRIIAVIDLAALLEIDSAPSPSEGSRLVVIAAASPFAFAVDTTLGLWSFARDAQTRTVDDGPIVCGRIEDRGGAATIIDTKAVFERVVAMRTERS